MKYIIAVMMLISLFGCDTKITPIDERVELPDDRIYAYAEKTEIRNASLIVTRDKGFAGSGCKVVLYINTKLAGRFNPGETKQFYVESGEVLIKVAQDPYNDILCKMLSYGSVERETFIKENKYKSYRIKTSGLDIQRIDY